MRKALTYVTILAFFVGCSTHTRVSNIYTAERTLQQADSLERSMRIYTDTTALWQAAEVFRGVEQPAQEARTLYHLGKAYLALEHDSIAFVCFSEAADRFLALSDSVYYPLSVLELSLIAERRYNEDGNATMLQAIRNLQREVIHTKRQHSHSRYVWWLLLLLVAACGCGVVFALRHNKTTVINEIKRDDLERNIKLLLSQGNVPATLHWDNYTQFCSTVDAYLYNVTQKLRIVEPQLSEQDIRFCVLVLLDLSAKETATVMRLSQNSISNKKTRTAQKLGTIAADLRETIIRITLQTLQQ